MQCEGIRLDGERCRIQAGGHRYCHRHELQDSDTVRFLIRNTMRMIVTMDSAFVILKLLTGGKVADLDLEGFINKHRGEAPVVPGCPQSLLTAAEQ